MKPSDAAPLNKQAGLTARRTLLALVGLSAAAGGAWWAWRKQAGTNMAASPQADAASAPGGVQAAPGDTVPAAVWQQQFDTPAGPALALSSFQGKPLLINFWATWCPPCVKEMPELDRFSQVFKVKGWHVIGLAIDSPTPVKAFLSKVGVGFDIGLAGMGGTELSQTLGNDAGGLPFTVLIDAQGRIRQRKAGGTHFDELAAWANEITP